MDTPRVWIACLASYNAGRLIGEWVDATDVDEMHEAKERVAAAAIEAAKKANEYPVYFGDPEEFAIHDYDGFPSSVTSTLGEYPNWETVAKVGALIEQHGETFADWLGITEADLDADDLEEDYARQYVGSADSEEDYARAYVAEVGWANVPSVIEYHTYRGDLVELKVFEELESYLDWESIARELFDHGSLTLVNGSVFDTDA